MHAISGCGVMHAISGCGIMHAVSGYGIMYGVSGYGIMHVVFEKRAQINSVSDLPLFIWPYVPNFLPNEGPARFWPTNIGEYKMRAV